MSERLHTIYDLQFRDLDQNREKIPYTLGQAVIAFSLFPEISAEGYQIMTGLSPENLAIMKWKLCNDLSLSIVEKKRSINHYTCNTKIELTWNRLPVKPGEPVSQNAYELDYGRHGVVYQDQNTGELYFQHLSPLQMQLVGILINEGYTSEVSKIEEQLKKLDIQTPVVNLAAAANEHLQKHNVWITAPEGKPRKRSLNKPVIRTIGGRALTRK